MKLKYILSLISILIVLHTFAQNVGDFEMWDSVHVHYYKEELANIHGIQNPMGGIPKNWQHLSAYGITRTTESYTEDFAIILHNWYSYIESKITFVNELNEYPTSISGYYKYIRQIGLSDSIQGVCKLVISNQQNEPIKTLNFNFDTCTSYKYFEFPIDQTSIELAKRIQITFKNSNSNILCQNSPVCNFLYLDDVTLNFKSNTTTNTSNYLNISPNPTTSLIEITGNVPDDAKIVIVNEIGKTINTFNNLHQINVSHLPAGIYFINILDKGIPILNKKIIKL
jgi:hypothetical protein